MPSFLDRFASRFPTLTKARFERDVQNEKQHVDRNLTRRPTATVPALVECDQHKAVWKITVPGQEDRFMILRSGHMDNQAFVVTVDAEKFYRTWLTRTMPVDASDRQDQCLLRNDMHRDYKYKSAAEGFAAGRENPVPLANCYMSKDTVGQTTVGFTNGVTRTMWLLANRAESFPVLVSDESQARELQRVAGVGPGPMTPAALFGKAHELQAKLPGERAAGQKILENLNNQLRQNPASGNRGRSYEMFD